LIHGSRRPSLGSRDARTLARDVVSMDRDAVLARGLAMKRVTVEAGMNWR